MNKVKVTLKAFEQVARNNDYEVFTPEEVAAYYKEGLMKSMAGQMDSANKEEFVSDIMHLQKAVVSDENGKETVRYYRKAQVKWEETANGIILKGLEGVYTDAPENRLLNRVGEAYVASKEDVEAILNGSEELAKAVKTGWYQDNAENRRLHRVGQPYKIGEEENKDVKEKEDETHTKGERGSGLRGMSDNDLSTIKKKFEERIQELKEKGDMDKVRKLEKKLQSVNNEIERRKEGKK